MAKSLTASKKVMTNYLSELLTDTDLPEKPQSEVKKSLTKKKQHKPAKTTTALENKSLEKLLTNVSAEVSNEEKVPPQVTEKVIDEGRTELTPLSTQKSRSEPIKVKAKQKSYREGSFQAMFFDVAGLTIAVPLIELGGIHKVSKTTSLVGKPDWFKGVMV